MFDNHEHQPSWLDIPMRADPRSGCGQEEFYSPRHRWSRPSTGWQQRGAGSSLYRQMTESLERDRQLISVEPNDTYNTDWITPDIKAVVISSKASVERDHVTVTTATVGID